ncbi:MAG: glycosyltransferase family 2 protein [Ilyomonas sp.]
MKNPLVSVCIAAYNAENYIEQTLNSLYEQSYPHIEIIVVNDGSKDSTLNLLKKQQKHNLVIINQDNKGQCAAANTAFKHAKGELIKFMDADDLISRDFIKNQVERLNGRNNAIASASWGRFSKDDLSDFQLNYEKVWKDMKPIDWLVESLWEGPNMMQCALWLIPRGILESSGIWDERLSLINDFEFFIRVLLASEDILFTKDAFLYYRSEISDSLSKQKTRKALESAYLSITLGIEHLLSFEDTLRVRKVCADYFQLWKYEFYPNHPDLFFGAEKRIEELGGSQIEFPAGGMTKLFTVFLGWKRTKKLKAVLSYNN